MAALLQRVDKLTLLLRRHTAKDRAFFGGLGQRLLTAQGGGVHPVLGPRNARACSHMADSLRVIARDDLDIDPLSGKKTEGLGGILPDAVLQRQQRQKFQLRCIQGGGRVGQGCVVFCQQQHTAALCQQRGKCAGQLPGAGPRQNIRCAHHIAALRAEILGAVLVRRVKGHRAHRKPAGAPLPKAVGQGASGVVVGLLPCIEGVQDLVQRRIFCQRQRVIRLHGALGDRAGLVHAEGIHPGKRFNAVHIPRQHPAFGKAHHAHGQRHTRQQVKPLGDHADERCHRGIDSLLHRQRQHPVLLPDQHRADRDKRYADKFDQPVKAAHHLAPGDTVAVGLSLSCQLAGVAVRADMGQPRRAAPRHEKAA